MLNYDKQIFKGNRRYFQYEKISKSDQSITDLKK
jgi:hypothetical protein